jgi:hypothetical protein
VITTSPEAHAAFHAALGEVRDVVKSKTADTGKYKYDYATLEQVLDAVKAACSAHDLVVSQEVTGDGDKFELCTTLLHTTGVVKFEPLVLPLPRDAQALGSAATYARRYSLVAIFAIAVEDDDGQEATRQARNAQQYDGNRTAHELAIRAILGGVGPDERKVLVDAFKVEHRMTLADLPEHRHSAALDWLVANNQRLLSTAAADNTADAAAVEPDPPATPPAGPSSHDGTEPSPAAAGEGGTQRVRLGSKAKP